MNDSTRRHFLQGAAAGGALAGIGAFSTLSQWLTGEWENVDGLESFTVPSTSKIDSISHMLHRTSFGPRPGDYQRVQAMGVDAYLEEQLHPERIDDSKAERVTRRYEALSVRPVAELLEFAPAELLDQMTRDKIQRGLWSKRQLYEVMVDFWSDHFNIDPSKGDARWLKVDDDREVIRPNALGSFRNLLRGSATSPAMLWYLDGRVNLRRNPQDHPNENYARELLELHTLGVDGGYSQGDVREVARCLTGWTVRERKSSRFAVGKVEFRYDLHDDQSKHILGHEIPAGLGAGDLDRVIDILIRHPATARHIAKKLCQRFVSESPTEVIIVAVAETFSRSGGKIHETLRTLFRHEEFASSGGEMIKRPYHFVLSALRATSAETDAGPALQDYLLRMGHAPFQFPTPDGYPLEAQPWMGTLLWRWRFALDLVSGDIKGTSLSSASLLKAAGSTQKLAAHLIGRQSNDIEKDATAQVPLPLAFVLASPAFQYC